MSNDPTKKVELESGDVLKADFIVRWFARNKAEGSMIGICFDLSDKLRTAIGAPLAPRPERPSLGYVPDLTEINEGLGDYNPEDY